MLKQLIAVLLSCVGLASAMFGQMKKTKSRPPRIPKRDFDYMFKIVLVGDERVGKSKT